MTIAKFATISSTVITRRNQRKDVCKEFGLIVSMNVFLFQACCVVFPQRQETG
jgi:hypothetical protein